MRPGTGRAALPLRTALSAWRLREPPDGLTDTCLGGRERLDIPPVAAEEPPLADVLKDIRPGVAEMETFTNRPPVEVATPEVHDRKLAIGLLVVESSRGLLDRFPGHFHSRGFLSLGRRGDQVPLAAQSVRLAAQRTRS